MRPITNLTPERWRTGQVRFRVRTSSIASFSPEQTSSSMTHSTPLRNIRKRLAGGHSTGPRYALAVCRKAGVRKVALTHHDPSRDDDAIDQIVERARSELMRTSETMEVLAATEGSTLCVKGKGARSESDTESEPANADTSALRNPLLLLLRLTDRSVTETILDAAHADQIPVIEAKSEYEVLRMTLESPPSLGHPRKKEGHVRRPRALRKDPQPSPQLRMFRSLSLPTQAPQPTWPLASRIG